MGGCCCCCCIATLVAFSLGTSRYLYVTAKKYNTTSEAKPVRPEWCAILGLLIYGVAFAVGAWVMLTTNFLPLSLGAGITVFLIVIGPLLIRVNRNPFIAPILMVLGFSIAFALEFFVWPLLRGY
jgi:hypothetical protein